MTINYSSKVADCKGLGSMWRLALRWRGSVYKLIWPDLLLYSLCFFVLSAVYRFCLHEDGKRTFEQVSLNLESFQNKIPIAFVLGFYVSIVIQRWWAQFENIGWPDALSVFVVSMILGNDEGGRMYRRQILRYVSLGMTMALTVVSPTVKAKYTTTNHFVEAGMMTRQEKKIIDALGSRTTHPLYWLPYDWAACLIVKARREGRISDDMSVKTMTDEINRLRGLSGMLLCYEWISIPLVYTQIVTVAVWSYFLATLMGNQFLDPAQKIPGNGLDYVVPVFTYIEFLVYVGWLKVAETLVNPFGDDDDDFEILWVIDRNLEIGYMMVDEMYGTVPNLTRDIHWDDTFHTKMKNSLLNSDYRQGPQELFDNIGPDFYQTNHDMNEDRLPILRSYSICGKRNCSMADYSNIDHSVAVPLRALPNFPAHGTWPSSKDPQQRARLMNTVNASMGSNLEKPMEDESGPSDKDSEYFDTPHAGSETFLRPRTDAYSNYKV